MWIRGCGIIDPDQRLWSQTLQISQLVAQSGARDASAEVVEKPAQVVFHSGPVLLGATGRSQLSLFLRLAIYKHTAFTLLRDLRFFFSNVYFL